MHQVSAARRQAWAADGGASRSLDNLRAIVILLVLAFHSALAYLSFLPPGPYPFSSPPYLWRAFAIVDSRRWVGLDLFCAWLDVFLMTLFFFLSGLFVWPSLKRRGAAGFLRNRILRLGLPFILAAGVLMPLASYATYRQGAADRGFVAYLGHLLALPFWPSGPMWFLWLLLAADLLAAGGYRLVPGAAQIVPRLSRSADKSLAWFLCGLAVASALAYVPLALLFTPMRWAAFGPFALQLSRPTHYAVYFFAGAALGSGGVEREVFAAEGKLARHWRGWLAAALASFAAWIALTALARRAGSAAPFALKLLDDLSFVAACFANCVFMLAVTLRSVQGFSRVLDSLKDNAYGMYLVHYLFVVWLQFALLGIALPGVTKAAIVFAVAVLLSWATSAALRRVPTINRLIGAGARRRRHQRIAAS